MFEFAEHFKQEVESLHAAGSTHLNATNLISPGTSTQQAELLEKLGIYEAEVTFDDSVASACPMLAAWSRDTSLRTLLSVLWPTHSSGPMTLASQATKLQFNVGTPIPGTATCTWRVCAADSSYVGWLQVM